MGRSLNIVDGDTWVGVYIDDKCVYQDHEFSALQFFDLMQTHGDDKLEPMNYFYADLDGLDKNGRFPNNLLEIRVMRNNESITVSEFWELS